MIDPAQYPLIFSVLMVLSAERRMAPRCVENPDSQTEQALSALLSFVYTICIYPEILFYNQLLLILSNFYPYQLYLVDLIKAIPFA